ncbi:type II toxin-antitoxin system HicB family antitoxin [Persicitalea sp.]|uniref:type II toxin-antitoxin system HicB family antitoxin n=1 Tax=Persicitalea sp. TaxID=3100273 RepID=UPI003593FC3F
MNELIFNIIQEPDGGYVAHGKLETGSIVTQGDDLPELKEMIKDAIEGYYFDKPDQKPETVLLRFEEKLALA